MKNLDIINNKKILVLVGIVYLIFWMLGFFSENKLLIENIFLIVTGLTVCASLIFTKKLNNIIIFILLIPFVFARPIDPLSIPIMIYVACVLLVIGLIIHYIRNKPKFKKGTLFNGLCFLGLGMILGGISIKSDYLVYQLGIMIFAVSMFIFAYVYFISNSEKISFENIALIFTLLGTFIAMQSIVFFFSRENVLEAMSDKILNVGWGQTNNIALMFLTTFPFTFYLYIKSSKKDMLVFICLLALQAIVFIFTHSRGGVISFIIELLLLFILILVFNKNNKIIVKRVLYIYLVGGVLLIFALIGLYFINKDYFSTLYKSLTHFDLDTLNGRLNVYEEVVKGMHDNLIFGKGVLSSMFAIEDEVQTYVWGHSTIIQTFTTMGIFGTIGLLYHFFEKYYVLFRKVNFEKIIIFLSLFGSGLYGLVDVSYYFINYMIVLVIIFIVCEPYFYNCRIELSNKLIKKEKTLENN